jgi:hypothetical protein
MNNKVKINVTISHYIIGQGIQYTSDIDPFYMRADELAYEDVVRRAIDDYCEVWAENTTSYNTNAEDYIIEFWCGDERIGKAILSNYADFFMD